MVFNIPNNYNATLTDNDMEAILIYLYSNMVTLMIAIVSLSKFYICIANRVFFFGRGYIRIILCVHMSWYIPQCFVGVKFMSGTYLFDGETLRVLTSLKNCLWPKSLSMVI